MTEHTQMGAAAVAQNEAGQPLTSAANEWEILAATAPNKDCTIQTVDPLFDSGKGVFWRCTLQKPEKCAAKDDKGVAVRVAIRFDVESIDTQGTKRAPGYVFRPRPYILEPASDSQQDHDAAERGRRDIARDMERLGLLPKTGAHAKGTLYGKIGAMEGAQAEINLWAKPGTQKDDDGNVKRFQNFAIRAVGAGGQTQHGTNNALTNV